MKFSYFFLELPPFLLLLIIVTLFAGIGVAGTYIFRKYIKFRYRDAHNEIVEYVFAVLGGFHGLLLGFVVFLVWSAVTEAQNNANKEASLATGLYREIRYFPDTAKIHPLMVSYLEYVHFVVEQEYPAMENMDPIPSNSHRYLNNVFKEVEKLNSREPRIEHILEELNELGQLRSLRQMDSSIEIPLEIWVPLLLSFLIIMAFAILVKVQSIRLHILINGLLGAFVGLVIFIIFLLDHPFTGKIKVEPTEYKAILEMHRRGD